MKRRAALQCFRADRDTFESKRRPELLGNACERMWLAFGEVQFWVMQSEARPGSDLDNCQRLLQQDE